MIESRHDGRRPNPDPGRPAVGTHRRRAVGFSVPYGANTEVMAELLPDLGAMHVRDTDAAVAPSEFEQAGNGCTVRVHPPLFMDVGPSDLLLRIWGYDYAGNVALLSVQTVDAGRR